MTPIQLNSSQLDYASTTAFASASTSNLPVRNFAPVSRDTAADERDVLLAAGLKIDTGVSVKAAELLSIADEETTPSSPASVDDALTSFLEDMMLDASFDR